MKQINQILVDEFEKLLATLHEQHEDAKGNPEVTQKLDTTIEALKNIITRLLNGEQS